MMSLHEFDDCMKNNCYKIHAFVHKKIKNEEQDKIGQIILFSPFILLAFKVQHPIGINFKSPASD